MTVQNSINNTFTTTAYSPICGGTSNTGPVQPVDSSIANSGYVLTSNGSTSLPTFQVLPTDTGVDNVNVQVFYPAGSYVYNQVTPTVQFVMIEVIGAGGGGGASADSSAGQISMGGSGGGGGYARVITAASNLGTGITIGVGGGGSRGESSGAAGDDGGQSVVEANLGNITANGGTGGVGGVSSVNATAQGVSGGSANTGDINATGGSSASGQGLVVIGSGIILTVGAAGGSIYGGGAPGYTIGADQSGIDGNAYGGGATGGACTNGGGYQNGGNGADGIVIITEYFYGGM